MLSSEKDIEDFIYTKRMVRLLTKTVLSHRQQSTVPYFLRYVIRDKNLRQERDISAKKKSEVVQQYEDVDLWDGLDPENSMADRLILYEIARRRYPGTEADANFSESEDSDYDPDDPEKQYLRVHRAVANVDNGQVNSSLLLNEQGIMPGSQA